MVRRGRQPIVSTPKPKPQASPIRDIGPWEAQRSILARLYWANAPMTVIDAGARTGKVTEAYLKLFPAVTVHAFEPEPTGAATIRKKFAGKENVHLYEVALDKEPGTREFHLGGQNYEMSSLLPRNSTGRRYYRHELKETVQVQCVTLDDFTSEQGIGRVHVLKLDLQGGEGRALEGASTLLAMGHIDVIYTEVLFVPLYQDCVTFPDLVLGLRNVGYTLFDIYNLARSHVNRQLKYGDAIFVGPQARRMLDSMPEDWLPKSLDKRLEKWG